MNNIKAVVTIIGQLNYILTKEQKRNSVLVFFCMIISSLFEMIGVSVVYAFLQLVMDEDGLKEKWYVNWIYRLFPEISFSGVILFFCIIIIIIFILKNGVTLLCGYVKIRYAAVFQRELSTRMLDSILRRPYEYFVNNNTEVILQQVHGDTAAAYDVLMNGYNFLSSAFTVVLIGAFLIYTDWVMAVSALMLAFACFILIVLLFKKRLKEAGKEVIHLLEEQAKASHQSVYGIKESTVMNRRESFVKKYADASKGVQRITILYGFLNLCPSRLIEAICIGGFIGIAGIRIAVGDNPADFIPTLGAFAMGAFKILPSVSSMSGQVNNVVFQRARLGRCYENLKEAERYDEELQQRVLDADVAKNEDGKKHFESVLEMDHIGWKYANTSQKVIDDLCMTIHKGEAVAFIGTSGAGKTTLADIILGLFRPQIGSVKMDGVDIAQIPKIWSQTIGYVPQSVYLTDDTIRANIAFGLFDDQIDDEKVWAALEQTQLADYIRSLPQGIYTGVGERGVRFSGGQRQRIAIARALYENPEILVLDEATSALDTETEQAVMQSIEALLGRKTMIIVAHRLSTIRNCDTIYEIKDGKAFKRDKKELFP